MLPEFLFVKCLCYFNKPHNRTKTLALSNLLFFCSLSEEINVANIIERVTNKTLNVQVRNTECYVLLKTVTVT